MNSSALPFGSSATNNRRCAQCGLINFASAATCRRCQSIIENVGVHEPAMRGAARGVARRLLWLATMIVAIVFVWSRSLLLTSQPITVDQRQSVIRAVAVLDAANFSREVLVLRHFANYRASDNWWNRYVGHQEAYAATNFPLGVLTLYAPFFTVAVDDTERAVILLHEAQHLLGAGEDGALERVWREKDRLGWTADRYGHTKVWKNTQEWTESAAVSP